jgi:hypothetical protein
VLEDKASEEQNDAKRKGFLKNKGIGRRKVLEE